MMVPKIEIDRFKILLAHSVPESHSYVFTIFWHKPYKAHRKSFSSTSTINNMHMTNTIQLTFYHSLQYVT